MANRSSGSSASENRACGRLGLVKEELEPEPEPVSPFGEPLVGELARDSWATSLACDSWAARYF